MLILPANLRAPFIAPGQRNRKVHWNAALSKAIRGLGRYEREDWRRGLVFPSGLFGLTRNYLAKKNNPGCVCCEPDNSCSATLDCYDGAWGGGSAPVDAEVELPSFANATCDLGNCPDYEGTYILSWNGSIFQYLENFAFGGPCNASSDFLEIDFSVTCITSLCNYVANVIVTGRDPPTTIIQQNWEYRPAATLKGSALPWSLDFYDSSSTAIDFGALRQDSCTLSGPLVVTTFA